MEIKFAGRMDGFEPGIFNVLDERKERRLAQGRPVYNLSIGTPAFPPTRATYAILWERRRS